MPCSHGNVADDVGNTMNKRLVVLVAVRRFFVKKGYDKADNQVMQAVYIALLKLFILIFLILTLIRLCGTILPVIR